IVMTAQISAQSGAQFTHPVLPRSNDSVVPLPPGTSESAYSSNLFPFEATFHKTTVGNDNSLSTDSRLSPLVLPIKTSPSSIVPLPLPLPVNPEELDLVLQHGRELEAELRWADVLSHYEAALRTFRGDEILAQRFRIARFHFDVNRRYHDTSYLKMIQTATFPETLGLYDRILTHIQQDYVDPPHWDEMFRHGVEDLTIALTDPAFQEKNGSQIGNNTNNANNNVSNIVNNNVNNNLNNTKTVNAANARNQATIARKMDDLREQMIQTADKWEIRNREDLKNGMLGLAEIAQKQAGVNPVAFVMEFLCGIVNALDPYTAYLTPSQLSDQFSMISGNLVGLGVELRSDRESLLIVRVIQGSPAAEGGLRDGDRILSVDGLSTKGRDTDSAANLLQGPEGTTTTLQVLSQGDLVSRTLRITRRQMEVPSVEDVRMLNDTLGYVKLTGFQTKTATELKQAILNLQQSGMECLVMDLRRNPGGLLQVGVEVANLFIESGPIVRTRGRQAGIDVPYQATEQVAWSGELIVLIDEESASASEIVAGAIRDHKRGLIVGKRSYGKGTIQAILPVRYGDPSSPRVGLRLTVEKFYSPDGLPYSGVGVTPHILIESENTYTVARPINGRFQVNPSRTVSSNLNDPFIRRVLEIQGKQ
ncbi:MAG: S41 family peptidase, partial [Thermoguttaceae bacterium]